MDSKDCIVISDEEEEEEHERSLADVSVQVIGEVRKHLDSEIICTIDNQNASIIDLTDASDYSFFCSKPLIKSTENQRESLQPAVDTASDPPSISSSASPPLIERSPSPDIGLSSSDLHRSSSQISPLTSSNYKSYSPLRSTNDDDTFVAGVGYKFPEKNSSLDPKSSSSSSFISQQDTLSASSTPRKRPQQTSKEVKQAAKANKLKEREELRQRKIQEKELERVRKEANRANTASRALQNCTAIVDKQILKMINDLEEANFRTLFEEASLNYKMTDYPKFSNCVTWVFNRTEVSDSSCVVKSKELDLILTVMNGADYVKQILFFRDDPNNSQSLINFIYDLHQRSQAMVVIIVYSLSTYLRGERLKEAKDYQKRFKERFESGRAKVNSGNNITPNTTILSITQTELQELRLKLQIELGRRNKDCKVYIEFREKTVEVVDSITKYTRAVATREIKKKEKASTNLDWAINMDKERAIDPTKTEEDLTRLWMAQLQQFSQITLPIAKTIASEYPSPCALLDQYQSLTHLEAQDLLAGLHVQRNLRRQVGPNISRRIYRFLTSEEPDLHIGFD